MDAIGDPTIASVETRRSTESPAKPKHFWRLSRPLSLSGMIRN